MDVLAIRERVEQRRHARQRAVETLARLQDLVAQVLDVAVAQLVEERAIEIAAEARERVVKNDPVGAAGDRNALERVGVADDLFAGAGHGAQAGAAGQDERSVDVEKHELWHGRLANSV